MNLLPSIILSASGVIVAALALYHRNDRSWQRAMTWIYGRCNPAGGSRSSLRSAPSIGPAGPVDTRQHSCDIRGG
jgi:hypothetical protein